MVPDIEPSSHQVEIQPFDALDRAEALADRCLFGGAIHIGNEEARGISSRRGRGLRRRVADGKGFGTEWHAIRRFFHGLHTQVLDGPGNRGCIGQRVGHRQPVGRQIEVHRLYPLQWLQHCAQLALFAGAIHFLDEVDDLLGSRLHRRVHADVVQGTQDGVLACGLVRHFQAAPRQIKGHSPDAIDFSQALADLGLLAGAVHVGDGKARHDRLCGHRPRHPYRPRRAPVGCAAGCLRHCVVH